LCRHLQLFSFVSTFAITRTAASCCSLAAELASNWPSKLSLATSDSLPFLGGTCGSAAWSDGPGGHNNDSAIWSVFESDRIIAGLHHVAHATTGYQDREIQEMLMNFCN
jgi:hypothetical protein